MLCGVEERTELHEKEVCESLQDRNWGRVEVVGPLAPRAGLTEEKPPDRPGVLRWRFPHQHLSHQEPNPARHRKRDQNLSGQG